MKKSLKKGMSFGLTSAAITTLGLIVGLNSSTGSKLAVISGILIIAIADAFSDALGVHISEESDETNSAKHVWEATIATFLAKFIFALTFLIPFLFFELNLATIFAVLWGAVLLVMVSYNIGRAENKKVWNIIFEHLFISALVVVASYYSGVLINNFIN